MNLIKSTAKILSLTVIFYLCSCALIYDRIAESCNSHAYLQRDLVEYIKSRFDYNSPVRAAIIPFAVPANLAAIDLNRPGIGNMLAWKIHAGILESGQIPIVEVFNRQDWPYKKEEFFTGNFGSLAMAREAGYDLLLVGYLDPPSNNYQMVANVKLMDVDSGVTVYYGKMTASTLRPDFEDTADTFRLTNKIPALTYTQELTDTLSTCIVDAVTKDPEE